MVRARGANDQSNISVTALGSFYFGPNYLTVDYFGPADEYVETVTIDGSKAGLVFGTRPQEFVIGATNGFSPSNVTMKSPASPTPKFTLGFKKGVFRTGASISFTLGQDEAAQFSGLAPSEGAGGIGALVLSGGVTFFVPVAVHSLEANQRTLSACPLP